MKPLWAIAAVAQNRVIGNNGKLPWRCPEDLKRFKKITIKHPIIMGRKTHESIGRPLPKRENIIITRNPTLKIDNCHITHTLAEAYEKATSLSKEVPIIIGGSEIYRQAMNSVTKLYITIIKKDYHGDTFFPLWDRNEWKEIEREDLYAYIFLTLERISE